jgi:hypothetical protein
MRQLQMVLQLGGELADGDEDEQYQIEDLVRVRAACSAADRRRKRRRARLWIANAFIAASGGTIDADSAGRDKGSTVTIELPVTLSAVPQLESDADD